MGKKTKKMSQIFCCTLFALSLWMISSPDSLSFYIHSNGSPVIKVLFPKEFLDVQLGIALSLLAIFFFFISFMGFYGAIYCSQFLLFMYSILVFLLLLLECAIIFYFTSNLIEKGIQVEDGQITHALRLAFHCCDQNYTSSADQILPPWSCCGVNGYPNNCSAKMTYTKNCQETITIWLQKYQASIYASVAVLHVILASCSLLRRAYSSSLSHT
ncbi:PREDICTED: 23 kDa integral membrane protein-like [Papilio xuthus]|uniref:23 kDa integral membrane protein-like n=1 Tax=Papilio xuthus TaxID=66420 RepID=A0AAJ6ZK70_PAPXU|nr:PREDICTED: 23 kDa integral membrane protein-like [Papilio xuthus]